MIWRIWKHLASPLETCELLLRYVTWLKICGNGYNFHIILTH